MVGTHEIVYNDLLQMISSQNDEIVAVRNSNNAHEKELAGLKQLAITEHTKLKDTMFITNKELQDLKSKVENVYNNSTSLFNGYQKILDGVKQLTQNAERELNQYRETSVKQISSLALDHKNDIGEILKRFKN